MQLAFPLAAEMLKSTSTNLVETSKVIAVLK
jgi:hypothetical protein